MNVFKAASVAGALIFISSAVPTVAAGQDGRALVRALSVADAQGGRIGVSVRDLNDDDKSKAGVVVDEVTPGDPADKAGIKAGDTITDFDGERVRSSRQFSRLVLETPPGRSVQAVLSRSGQHVTVNVTPESSSWGDNFGMRLLDAPRVRVAPTPPTPPRPATPPPPPSAFRWDDGPFNLLVARGSYLGVTMENLSGQLADYFGVKDGVLITSVQEDSAASKAGIKAGDIITRFNDSRVYEMSDVTHAMSRMDSGADFTIEVMRDRKTQTLKGKLDTRSSRPRVRTGV
jgi:serine protease Do